MVIHLLWKNPKFATYAILMAAICQPVLAASSCVNPGGTRGCFDSIAAAVAAARPGGTINVAPGTYKEAVIIGQSVSLIGAGSGRTIIDATGLSNAVYIDGLDNPRLRSVTVSGFTLENANYEGLLITNAVNVTITGNLVIGNNTLLDIDTDTCPDQPPFETGEDFDCGEGIHIMGVSYSTFSNNVSANNSGGFLISDDTGETHDNLITGNIIKDNPYDCGITLASHAPGPGSNAEHNGIIHNIVSNNQSTHNGYLEPGAGAGVGIFSDGSGIGHVHGNIIIGNVLTNNGLPGVAFHSHVGPNFGAPADDLNGNFILNNRIAGNGADVGDTPTPGPAGININSGFGGTPITGNVISGNSITDESADIVVNTPGQVELHLNNLLGGDVGVANLNGGSVDATLNYWGCFNGPGAKGCSTVSGPVTYIPFLRIQVF
jgi:hypothetical protein